MYMYGYSFFLIDVYMYGKTQETMPHHNLKYREENWKYDL